MEKWNEKLIGFLYYIPGCERVRLIIDGEEVYKGFIFELPKKYLEIEIEELRGFKKANHHYLQFTGHYKAEKPSDVNNNKGKEKEHE